jgi:hypothetical protein
VGKRLAGLAVALTAVVALAGCGGEGTVLESTAAQVSGVPAAATPAFLAQAAERTAAVETGKVEVEITADGGTATLTGQFDTTRPAGAATLTTSGLGGGELGDISAEVVYEDGTVYLKPDGLAAMLGESLGTPWLKVSAQDGALGGLLPGGAELPTVEPQELLEKLRAEGIEVTQVGTEDVRGVSTTRYAAQIPADAGSLGGPAATVDAWIDGDGLVRRITIAASGDTPFTVDAELYDLGEPVSISAPPADQVTDLGDLGELFGSRPR